MTIPSTDAAIDTTALAKRYGTTTALAGLTMRVSSGHVFGFLGPNGAGKTTAVKLLLGLARPTSGAATVLGAPLGDRATRRRIGYLPELFRYQAWLTARDVLGLHASLAELPRAGRRAAIDEALGIVGLADRAGDRVGTFSKGMQQRLGIGVALLGRPDLVFLDEPTSALDPIGRQDVRRHHPGAARPGHGGLPQLAPADRGRARLRRGRDRRSRPGRRGGDAGRDARGRHGPRAGDRARRGRPSEPHARSGRSRTIRRGSSSGAARRSACPTWSPRSWRPAAGSTRSTPAARRSRSASSSCSATRPIRSRQDRPRDLAREHPRDRPADAPGGAPPADPARPDRAHGRHRGPDRPRIRGHRRQRPTSCGRHPSSRSWPPRASCSSSSRSCSASCS